MTVMSSKMSWGSGAKIAEPPIERAEHWAKLAAAGARDLTQKVRGPVEDLFGHIVAAALLPDIDNATESASEAMYHFREAVDLEQRRARVAQMERSRAVEALIGASVAIQTRFRGVSGESVLPDDLQAVVQAAAELVGWSWLWSPTDYRHTHEGGNCRNPACHYNSDAARVSGDGF